MLWHHSSNKNRYPRSSLITSAQDVPSKGKKNDLYPEKGTGRTASQSILRSKNGFRGVVHHVLLVQPKSLFGEGCEIFIRDGV